MRHNLLSITQMCNNGYEVFFSKSRCVIRKGKSRRLVAEDVRTSGNVYYIKDKSGH